MKKLRYCDITRRSDIVTEQECSHAISARHLPQCCQFSGFSPRSGVPKLGYMYP